MKTIERVMRAMTHLNIGATLAMGAWILWSGHEVVVGDWPKPVHSTPSESRDSNQRPSALPPDEPPCCGAPTEWRQASAMAARVDGAQPPEQLDLGMVRAADLS